MAHEARGSGASRTIAALNFQTERMREKAGELVPIVRHEEILGAAVDQHHKSKSLLGAGLPRHHHVSEVRAQFYSEVDEFDDDDDDAYPGTGDVADELAVAGQASTKDVPRPSLLLHSADTPSKRGLGAGNSQKKLHSGDFDPLNMLRRMRSQTPSRSNASFHATLEAVKRAGCAPLSLDDEDLDDDDISLHKDLTLVRGKSFLSRPDLQSGAAEDMLAQIRGAKWQSDSIVISRSSKSISLNQGDSSLKAADCLMQSVRSDRGTSGSCGSMGISLPGSPAGASKSLSAGKRSGALPGVSVDSSSRLSTLACEQDHSTRSTSRPVPANPPPGGLFSKFKHIMKQ